MSACACACGAAAGVNGLVDAVEPGLACLPAGMPDCAHNLALALSGCAAAAGVNGLVDAVEPGLACGSDTSHMNLLGYDPRK
jgi:2,3-bisphosphoglycerate-independent phosphoglycerate mutase